MRPLHSLSQRAKNPDSKFSLTINQLNFVWNSLWFAFNILPFYSFIAYIPQWLNYNQDKINVVYKYGGGIHLLSLVTALLYGVCVDLLNKFLGLKKSCVILFTFVIFLTTFSSFLASGLFEALFNFQLPNFGLYRAPLLAYFLMVQCNTLTFKNMQIGSIFLFPEPKIVGQVISFNASLGGVLTLFPFWIYKYGINYNVDLLLKFTIIICLISFRHLLTLADYFDVKNLDRREKKEDVINIEYDNENRLLRNNNRNDLSSESE